MSNQSAARVHIGSASVYHALPSHPATAPRKWWERVPGGDTGVPPNANMMKFANLKWRAMARARRAATSSAHKGRTVHQARAAR